MSFPLGKQLQQKTPLLYLAGAIGLVIVGALIYALIITIQKPANKVEVSQQSPLEALEQDHTKLRQTLEQEKIERAKVKQALDAPNHYQKLAE